MHAIAYDSEIKMSIVAAALFAIAFIISAYSIMVTLAHKWPRIETVAAMQGMPAERLIRVGQVRHTGQRMRLVVINELESQNQQRAFKFVHLRAA
jgi:hypothetical protein